MRQAAQRNLDPSRQAEPSSNAPCPSGTGGQRQPLDLAALRRQVSIEQVLRHLGYLDPLRGSGPQRRGPCPLHDAPGDRHRSFSVHLGKGVFRCFHPECQAQGNTLDLSRRLSPPAPRPGRPNPRRNLRPPLDITREIGDREPSDNREEEPVNGPLSTR